MSITSAQRRRRQRRRAAALPPQERSIMVLVLLLHAMVSGVHGFTTPPSPSCTGRHDVPHVQYAIVDPFQDEAPNLYKILGASPKDSTQELKRKWQLLARKLHPDANVYHNMQQQQQQQNGDFMISPEVEEAIQSNRYPYDLSDINAAWGVLSDPRERRRYDRALQAKEVADTFEVLLDAGIQSAIPFLRKTAATTVAAVETSSKTWNTMSRKSKQAMANAKAAAAIFEMEQEARELELKASRARSKIQQLQTQLATSPDDRRIETLRTKNARLTSADARRVLGKLTITDDQAARTRDEILRLEALEAQSQDMATRHVASERAVTLATKQVQDAMRAEERAIERLQQAQRDLADAQARTFAVQQSKLEATAAEKRMVAQSSAAVNQVVQQTEQVRYLLQQNEDQSLQLLAELLHSKIQELTNDVQTMEGQAQIVKANAQQLKEQHRQELEHQRRQQQQEQQ